MKNREKILFEGKTKVAICNGREQVERDWYGRDHSYEACNCATWPAGQTDPAQVAADSFADSEIAKGYANPDCLDSSEDFAQDA